MRMGSKRIGVDFISLGQIEAIHFYCHCMAFAVSLFFISDHLFQSVEPLLTI